MEYLAHDGQNLHKIYITRDFIDIQDNRYPVNKVSLFTENEGKIQTDSNIVRYTKGSLYLYDTRHNLLRVYLFSKKYNKEPPIEFDIQKLSEDIILKNKFSLKPGVIIELYIKPATNTYYIKKITDNDSITYSNVKTTHYIGDSIIYITEEDHKLTVSKKYKCTYNGCPIGQFAI